MRFVLCKAPESATYDQQAYICEGTVKQGRKTRQVRPGDLVVGEFGELMEVVETSATRRGLGLETDYPGPVKVCSPASVATIKAYRAAAKAWEDVTAAEQAACEADAAFRDSLNGV